jgi:hypothetical protein
LRLTRYIYIRGGGYYVDLEPRRMVEINAILEQDNGAAKEFSLDEYKQYIAFTHGHHQHILERCKIRVRGTTSKDCADYDNGND